MNGPGGSPGAERRPYGEGIPRTGDGPPAEPVVISWSGGKDSALALARLQADPHFEVVGLLTTVTAGYDRISIHGIRRTLLYAQSAALGVPVQEVVIAPACSNAEYERAFAGGVEQLQDRWPHVRRIVFGDIFLDDVRRYREDLIASRGFGSIFPLWGESTTGLAEEVFDRGIAARLVTVDTHALDAAFAGRPYTAELLADLPVGIDPCGENGEFHTFVSHAPGFSAPIRYEVGDVVLRDDRFAFCDLVPVKAVG